MMPREPAGRAAVAVERTRPIHRAAIAFLVTFLLIFPKGGIKVGPVPLTWGYLALVPFSVLFGLLVASGRGGKLSRARLIALSAMLPFQATVWGSFMVFGAESFAWAVALLVAIVFLPFTFVLVFAPYLDALDLTYLYRLIRWGVLLVAIYGIVLFAVKLATGRFFEIPLLTVNQGDVGDLESKHIDRGGIFKLISTYNNGNIYGISLLLLLPFYSWLERSRVRNGVVKASLVLTLSRTVWIGLVLHEILSRAYVRRLTVRAGLLIVAAITGLAAAVWYVAEVLLGKEILRFLLDPNLGGRAEQLQDLHPTLLPARPFSGVAEIVYVAVLDQFGIVGLATFVLGLAAPLALHLLGCLPYAGSEYKRSIAAGIAIYLVVSFSDGALLLIPVMAFYWFAVSLLLSSNPSFAEWPNGEQIPGDTAPPLMPPHPCEV